MHLDVYSICWNERPMLPFFLRHYLPIADRIVIYDDDSDDGSVDYLQRFDKVEVRRFERVLADSFEGSKIHLQNACWKESRGRADYVVMVDIDEHIHHPDLPAYLRHAKDGGVSMLPAVGFTMVSDAFPDEGAELCSEIRCGARSPFMHKPSVFDPDAVEEILFTPGCHGARPRGRIRYPELDELTLLHYKHLGLDYLLARRDALQQRLLKRDRAKKWAHHWSWDESRIAAEFRDLRQRAAPVLPRTHPHGIEGWEHRWWRPQRPRFRRKRHQQRYLASLESFLS